MKVTKMANGAVSILLELKEQETLGLMIANDVVGEVGHGEHGLAEGIMELGDLSLPYWGRGDITHWDAVNLIEGILTGIGGFQHARDVMQEVIQPIIERTTDNEIGEPNGDS